MTDARARLEVARELWSEGRISLDPSRVSRPAFWIERADGRVVSFYGLGQSLAFVPFDVAGRALSAAAGVAPGAREFVRWLPVGLGLLPLLGVAWWIVLRGILREAGFDPAAAAISSAAILVTTLAFFYVSNEQEESLVGCLAAAALLQALRWRRLGGAIPAAAAGAFAGLAVLTRVDALFGLLPAAMVLAGRPAAVPRGARPGRFRELAFAALAFGAAAGGALLYNRARFGSFFETGYRVAGLAGLWRLDRRCARTAIELLFGPGKGWFVLSPMFLVALLGLPAAFRRFPRAGIASALGFGGAVVFYSAYQGNSDGPWSWGTRYLACLATLWAVPLAIALDRASRRHVLRRGVIAVAALSAILQLSSVFVTQNLEYVRLRGGGVRDWSVLMTSARRGQLYQRFRNIANWARSPRREDATPLPPNEWMPPGTDAEKAAFIEARYIPNFWGPSFAKLLAGRARVAVLAAWIGCLVAGLALLSISLARLRSGGGPA